MFNKIVLPLILIVSLGYFSFLFTDTPKKKVKLPKTEKKLFPSDWFHYQRSYPNNDIPFERYYAALEKTKTMGDAPQSALNWLLTGPTNVGGRITAVAVDPANTNIIIAGTAAGGIFKTTNGGLNWSPKTDFKPGLAIGSLAMDPTNSNIIYCGTGEPNNGTDNYGGFGMLKSTDKGETWNLIGLADSKVIAGVVVHPLKPTLLYAAVSGGLYSKGTNRGIYKSNNSGLNWTQVFFMNDSTSAIDIAVDPQDTSRIYCAMMERLRGPTFRKAGGVSSGVFMSTNAGANWSRLGNGLPAAANNIGRICIAVAPSNPNYVYALYRRVSNPALVSHDNVFEGFYKSTNKGANWTKMPNSILPGEFSNFGWYFGLITIDPTDFNKVYVGDIDIYRTTNGGTAWTNVTEAYSGTFDMQHPDQHALWVNPANANHMINGNDGGIFTTTNGGVNWSKKYDLPISQFYASTIDYLLPHRKYGGMQDNGTAGTQAGGTGNWEFFYGGDGFVTLVDYTNSNTIYAESQFGNIGRSTDGGNFFTDITNGLDLSRTNWHTPFILDNVDPNILYFGSYRLYRTTNKGNSWTAISPDLTRGPNGRLGTITCISSAVPTGNTQRVLYVGTDDWKVSVSTNTGSSWTDVTGNLPQRYVTDVLADKRNPAVAYVTLSGYNLDDGNAHIFRTTNYGANWTDISSNMPDIPVNSIIIDYNRDSVLYVGTDAGVFYTRNLGGSWSVLGTGMPNAPVFDLNFHQPTQKLVAGTHGRSIWELDVTVLPVKQISTVVGDYKLHQNYPNPFNPKTKIIFDIKKSGFVTLKVFDISGREITTLVSGVKLPGSYEAEFDGAGLASGAYFYRIEAGDYKEVKKMLLIK